MLTGDLFRQLLMAFLKHRIYLHTYKTLMELGITLQLESRKAPDILNKDQCLYTSLEHDSLIGNICGKR